MKTSTFFLHASFEALAEAAVATLVALVFVDYTVSVETGFRAKRKVVNGSVS